MSDNKKVTAYSIFVWLLAILFFFYEFFLRVLPATTAKSIIDSLDIGVEQFAIIGSAYYLVYSFMQIPVGLLLDRLPARLLITVAAAMCSLGALWFSFAHGFMAAFIARLMIGFGSSFGFIALMIVTLNWFPRKYFAFLIGCGQFLGALGPLVAGAPIAIMLQAVDGNWRIIFFGVALFGIGLSFLIGVFLKGKPQNTNSVIFIDKVDPLSKRVKSLLKSSQVGWILGYSAMIYVTMPLLGAFWGTSYLETRGFEKPEAALIISMIWVGLAIGSPLFGRLSDTIKRRKILLATCALMGIIGSLLVLYTRSANIYYLCSLFFCIGIAGSGQNLSFAVISEYAPKTLRATALSMNNTAIMGFAAILPPIVTSMIQYFANGGPLTEAAFEKGLMAIPLVFSIALIISLVGIKETYCRQQNTIHHLSP